MKISLGNFSRAVSNQAKIKSTVVETKMSIPNEPLTGLAKSSAKNFSTFKPFFVNHGAICQYGSPIPKIKSKK